MRGRLLVSVLAVLFAASIAVAGPVGGTGEGAAGWASGVGVSSEGGQVEPKIVEKPELTLVGIVDVTSDVTEMDIHGLWQRFLKSSDQVKHQVEGAGYELHLQTEAEPTMHFCLVGVEVSRIEDVPEEMFIKVVPAGTYAVFTHRFADGGFDKAYERVGKWLEESGYTDIRPFDIQRYDARFTSMDDPNSELEIYVPVGPK